MPWRPEPSPPKPPCSLIVLGRQAGGYVRRELVDLGRIDRSKRDQIRQRDRILHRQLPIEHAH